MEKIRVKLKYKDALLNDWLDGYIVYTEGNLKNAVMKYLKAHESFQCVVMHPSGCTKVFTRE
jgi:hypothetical protein